MIDVKARLQNVVADNFPADNRDYARFIDGVVDALGVREVGDGFCVECATPLEWADNDYCNECNATLGRVRHFYIAALDSGECRKEQK